MNKYILTKVSKEVFGVKLFQIKALVAFGSIEKGELGGWIEKENNLSQEGNAQVYGNAWVYCDAQVSGNAQVYGNAQVSGNAQVYGDARVFGDAQVYGNAWVFGDAWVYGKLKLLAGFFFSCQYKNEEIKTAKIDEDYSIVYKGDAKFGTDEPEQSLSGKKVSVELDGKKYTATID